MRHVHIRIEGLVQGVGFRVFVQRVGTKHGVKGLVRNRRDGSVEALLCGSSQALDATIDEIKIGPRGSRVDFIKVFECDGHDDVPISALEIGATV